MCLMPSLGLWLQPPTWLVHRQVSKGSPACWVGWGWARPKRGQEMVGWDWMCLGKQSRGLLYVGGGGGGGGWGQERKMRVREKVVGG